MTDKEGTAPTDPLTPLNAPEGPISDTGPEFQGFNEDAGPVQLAEVFDQPDALREQTPVEIAGHKLIDYLAGVFVSAECKRLADDLEDKLVREEASRITTPRLLEVTGNVEERELAARLCEAKAQGAKAIGKKNASLAEIYDVVAQTFLAAAADFRSGLHLPEVIVPPGRVIGYNESNDTGLRHADPLRAFFVDAHARNLKAGWWTDIATGQPKKRNVAELLILMVTEIVEAYEAYQQHAPDDKLPQYPGVGVEMGDLAIRLADFAGAALAGNLIEFDPESDNPGQRMFEEIAMIARHYESIRKTPAAVGSPETASFLQPMDIADMIDVKLDFNAHRPDHKIENRLKDDGKRT